MKFDFKGIANVVKDFTSTHSPEILTGIGVAGMITTTVLAVKATPKALQLMDEAENKKNGELTKVEAVKACWKCYIPTVITGAISISCIIGSNSVNAKRNAALATAYKLSDDALKIYKSKVVETIGESKVKQIDQKVAKEHLDRHPINNNEIIVTGDGETLCMDVISGKTFKSDINKIKKAVNDLNYQMIGGRSYISLSEFYDELGLKHTKNSDRLGWNLYREGQIDIHYSSQLLDDGRPCLVIDYNVEPRYEFDTFL